MDVPETHFPSLYRHHVPQQARRDYFLDCGSHLNFDVDSSSVLDTGRVNGESQKSHSDEWTRSLRAKLPTLPFSKRPNIVPLPFHDPIGDIIKENQQRAYFFIKKIQYHQGRLSRETMHSYQCAMQRVGRVVSNTDHGGCSDVDMLCQSLPYLKCYVKNYEDLRHNNRFIRVNSMYTGGCLENLKLRNNNYVLYPSTPDFNTLNIASIRNDPNHSYLLKEKVVHKLQLPSQALEVRTSYLRNTGLCCVRHASGYTLYRVADEGEIIQPALVDEKVMEDRVTSICLSPYISNEVLTSTEAGSVILTDSGDGCGTTVISEQELRFRCTDSWRHSHWGAHPREVILADRSCVQLFDIRAGFKEGLDLLAQPTKLLHGNERVMVAEPLPGSPFHHLIATDFSLLLMDQRLPHYPVMMWSHSLPSAPQYLTTVKSDENSSIILLANQTPSETHCFHLKHSNGRVQSCHSPWRCSRISDFFMYNQGKDVVEKDLIKRRLHTSLAGVTACSSLPGRDLQVFQLTSHGEVYFQVYKHDEENGDKTQSYGPGGPIHMEPAAAARARKWTSRLLAQFENLTVPAKCFSSMDASYMLKGLSDATSLAHVLCPLCMPSTRTVVNTDHHLTDVCNSCSHSVHTGHLLARHDGKTTVLENTEELQAAQFDEDVPKIDAFPQLSGNSQVLVKQWFGETGEIDRWVKLREEERKKVEECERKKRHELRQQKSKVKQGEISVIDEILRTKQVKIREEIYDSSDVSTEDNELPGTLASSKFMPEDKTDGVDSGISCDKQYGTDTEGSVLLLKDQVFRLPMRTLKRTNSDAHSTCSSSISRASRQSLTFSLPGFSSTPARLKRMRSTSPAVNLKSDSADEDDQMFFSQEAQQSLGSLLSTSITASPVRSGQVTGQSLSSQNDPSRDVRKDRVPSSVKKKRKVPGF